MSYGPNKDTPSAAIAYLIGLQIYAMFKWVWEKITNSGKKLVIFLPFTWLTIFFLIPFLIILKISFTEPIVAQPPVSSILMWAKHNTLQIQIHFGNFLYLFEDGLYLFAYLNSVKIAFVSTLLCLAIGYPMAYAIANARPGWRIVLLVLVMMPFWTPFLIRIYAWISILKTTGFLNSFLMWLGVIHEPLNLLYTNYAVYIGITYSYLPFMILPLYATLEKLNRTNRTFLEAAADLGCRPFSAFMRITLPLSFPGIIAGSLLVFIPAIGEFVIPELLGGPETLMIGKVVWSEFFSNQDWPIAAAVTIALLMILVLPIIIFQHVKNKQDAEAEA